MSASMKQFCLVNNLNDIKLLLVPEIQTKQEIYRDDDWDNRWNWDTSELVYEDDESKKSEWLGDCIIALSPFVDTLVIGRDKTISIFGLDGKKCFNLNYTTTLKDLDKDEILTSIILIPFISHQKTAVNFKDWTAIVCGFSTGYFRIYTENGKNLMSYLFHDEPILNIKCRTYSVNHLLADQSDEILIVYPTAVIQINGFTLYQALRLCRNRIAQFNDMDSAGKFINDNSQTPFTFKKWSFQTLSDGRIYDCVNVCSTTKNDFDSLVSHSINGKTWNSNQSNRFLTTGTNHFVGFYRAEEGISHTIIDELSNFLINRFKNVFSFFNQQKEFDPKDNIKPSTNVPPDLALFDERLGLNICLSPNRRLAAITDDFGRVILFDVENSIAIRIWKGYRKAEVGWIVVEEESNNGIHEYYKQAQFLLIYAPKRGILEIWCSQNGPRVTAFNVGKNCKLIYTDHIMFGLNNILLKNIKQTLSLDEYSQNFVQSKCFLFNYETGKLFTFTIPFLCSLTDKNSKKTRDFHILKDLKNLINKDRPTEKMAMKKLFDDVVNLMLLLETAEIKRECINLIISSDDAEFILFCIEKLLNNIKSRDINELSFENKLIAQMCTRIVQLCKYYRKMLAKMKESKFKYENLINESNNPPEINELINDLDGWSENDVVRIVSLVAFRQSVLNEKLMQPEHWHFSISEFLSYFTLYYNHLAKHNNPEEYFNQLPVEILLMKDDNNMEKKMKTSVDQFVSLDKVSCFLFWATFCADPDNLNDLLNEVCLVPSNVLLLLFHSWLNSNFSIHWPCWKLFSNSFAQIIEMDWNQGEEMEKRAALLDFDDYISLDWLEIMKLIYNSTNITSAFIATNMIKALVQKVKLKQKLVVELEQEQEADKEMDKKIITITSDNEWETLCLNKENLNQLTKKLEDLFLLDLLLKSCTSLINDGETLNGGVKKLENISFSSILSSGPGIVSEIVARYAIFYDIKPDILVCSPRTEDNAESDSDSTIIATELKLHQNSTLIEIMDHVRRCFPNCLDSDILLINCFWEILLQWNAEPCLTTDRLTKSLDYLRKVSNSVLKHNVLSMGWRLFLQKRLEILCNLIEKMGKKPKDRIIRKELDMDENNLEEFVNFSFEYIDFMIQTNVYSKTEAHPIYTLDDWWQGFNSKNQYNLHFSDEIDKYEELQINKMAMTASKELYGFNMPLAVVAMHQKTPNIDLLIEYYHLIQCLQFIVIFSLRNVRPLSLFPSSKRAYFFKDLFSFLQFDSKESINLPTDPVLEELRYTFFNNILVNIVQTIPVIKLENEDKSSCHSFYVKANKWFDQVVQLAMDWNLDIDKIRMKYVVDLFLYGCDPLAKELMYIVSDSKALCRKLLIISGMRLCNILNNKYSSLDEVSFLAPNVLFWIKSLITDPNCAHELPYSTTIELLEKISNVLYDDIANFRICEELLSAFKTLTKES